MLTNNGLVKHAQMALDEGWGYVWGTFGNVLYPEIFQDKLLQYPDGVGKYASFIQANWLNKRTADCIGLIKSYLWWNNGLVVYDPKTDLSADDMFYRAEEKGPIRSFPTKPLNGLLVWKQGHIGIYVGDGQVIESHGTTYGVIKTPLQGDRATYWTHWCKCPFITYESSYKDWIQLINETSNGSADAWVNAINVAVNAAKADGNLGPLEIFQHLPKLIELLGNKK